MLRLMPFEKPSERMLNVPDIGPPAATIIEPVASLTSHCDLPLAGISSIA